MIGKEDNQEEPELKVTDRRKFNVDGSLREGVVIEEEEQKTAPEKPVTSDVISTDTEIPESSAGTAGQAQAAAPSAAAESEVDLLEDDNPASFVNFLSTLVTNAAASLGAVPHPVTGQKTVDLETGKYWIDVLVMLREKTSGNLDMQEQSLLESILGDLQMQYIQLARAAEEKLKAQAARKFSSKDILGG